MFLNAPPRRSRAFSIATIATIAVMCAATTAHAQRASTSEALSRMEETLALRESDGVFSKEQLAPIIIVSTAPAYEETRAWFPGAATASLARVFGPSSLRACEACMAPQLRIDGNTMDENLGALTVADVVKIDDAARGSSSPAKTGVWLDETARGVALRVIDLKSSRIIYADAFDPTLKDQKRTAENMRLTRELERRQRGDSITHIFFDAALYPGQHVSMDITDQWGDNNENLSGLSLSAWDPLAGVGACYYRVIPEALNLSIGAQVLVSLPTGLVQQVLKQNTQVIDPLVTGVAVVRLPIGDTNYAVLATLSTNGRVGVGLSLMNVSFLPVIP